MSTEIDCNELAHMESEDMLTLLRELGDFDLEDQSLDEQAIRDYIIENYAEDCFHLHSESQEDYYDYLEDEDEDEPEDLDDLSFRDD